MPPWAAGTSTASSVWRWDWLPRPPLRLSSYTVTSHVQELADARVHPVFLLDEAHLLHADVLAHLHILLNYELDSRALLSVVLVGLPDLEKCLRLSTHKSLLSRLQTRLYLDLVTPEDSADYLRHRLKLAGGDRELFPSKAVALLPEASQGAPRELERLSTVCLQEPARRRRKLVDSETVRTVLDRKALSAAQCSTRSEPFSAAARCLPLLCSPD